MKKTLGRGGKREGAGRKPLPLDQRRIMRGITLPPDMSQHLDVVAGVSELTLSEAIELMLEDYQAALKTNLQIRLEHLRDGKAILGVF